MKFVRALRASSAILLLSSFCWPQAPPAAPPPASIPPAAAPETQEPQAAPQAREPSPAPAEAGKLSVSGVFHIVGVPGLKRNAHGNLVVTTTDLTFLKDNKPLLVVPYARIERVEVISGERHYGKTTAAAVAVSPLGAFLIFAKRHVDTMVVEYLNERNGKMALVLHLPEHEGVHCQEWMARYGVKTEAEKPQPAAAPEKK